MERVFLSIAEAGGSVVVGLSDDSNTPIATRGWSTRKSGDNLNVMVADEPSLGGFLEIGSSISVTTSNVFSYETIQAVGTILSVSAPDESDRLAFEENAGVFLNSVGEALFVPIDDVKGMLPGELKRITFEPSEYFNQTPGAKK